MICCNHQFYRLTYPVLSLFELLCELLLAAPEIRHILIQFLVIHLQSGHIPLILSGISLSLCCPVSLRMELHLICLLGSIHHVQSVVQTLHLLYRKIQVYIQRVKELKTPQFSYLIRF